MRATEFPKFRRTSFGDGVLCIVNGGLLVFNILLFNTAQDLTHSVGEAYRLIADLERILRLFVDAVSW